MKTELENTLEENDEKGLLEKAGHFAEEKKTQVGEALELANEKVAGFKEQAETSYTETISPAIDRAQINFAGASRYLQESAPGDYLKDLETFARNHPRISAGVCALIGWKIGRALKFTK